MKVVQLTSERAGDKVVLQLCHGYQAPFTDVAANGVQLFCGKPCRVITAYLTGDADDAVAAHRLVTQLNGRRRAVAHRPPPGLRHERREDRPVVLRVRPTPRHGASAMSTTRSSWRPGRAAGTPHRRGRRT